MIACILYYIPFLLVFSYLLFASLCTRVPLSSLSFSLIRSLVSAISRSSLVTNIFNDQTAGTDFSVCSLGITTISPGVNALRLHGWRHPLHSYLPLVLFPHSASQPFSWCWCGPDRWSSSAPGYRAVSALWKAVKSAPLDSGSIFQSSLSSCFAY